MGNQKSQDEVMVALRETKGWIKYRESNKVISGCSGSRNKSKCGSSNVKTTNIRSRDVGFNNK